MANNRNQKVPGGRASFPGVIIVIAIVVVVLLIVWIARQPRIAAHPSGRTAQQSQKVDFSNVTVTPTAGMFSVEATATNKTAQPLTRVTVEVGFENLTGKTLEKVEGNAANADGTDLKSNPIPPHQSRAIRIPVSHAPAGWDEKAPDLTVVGVDQGTAPAPAQGQTSTNPAQGEGANPK